MILQTCFCCSGCSMQLERKFFTQEDLPVCEECYKVSLDHGGDFDVKYGDDSMLVIVAILMLLMVMILMLVMVFDVWFGLLMMMVKAVKRAVAVVGLARVTLDWRHLNGESTYKAEARHINEPLSTPTITL